MKKIKCFLSLVLCLVMLISSVPLSAFAVDGNTKSFEGYIPISTKADLNAIRNDLSAKYYLTNNIVFSESDFSEGGNYYNDGAGWSPIGTYDEPFVGTLDGNGYAIKNLKISINSSSTVMAGLFGFIEGNIVNLGMDNCSLSVRVGSDSDHSSNVYVGGFVARSDSYDSGFQIDSCYFSGNISVVFERGSTYDQNKLYVGGIIGKDYADIEIKNCINYGNIEVQATDCNVNDVYLGGILGYGNSTLLECSNRGELKAYAESDSYYGNAYTYVGGIAGNLRGDAKGCTNIGVITATSKTADNSYICEAYSYAGGIAAYAVFSTITDSSNSGVVKAVSYPGDNGYRDEANAYAGGISGCGRNVNHSQGQIIGSNNSGKIITSVESNYNGEAYVGGISGYDSIITNCYNVGEVASTTVNAESFTGGISGKDGHISCCYNSGDVKTNLSGSGWVQGSYIGAPAIGGIIGLETCDDITNCFNSGEILVNISNTKLTTSSVGGIAGASDSNVNNCYNIGNINISDSPNSTLGGIVGGCQYITSDVADCYYLNTTKNGVGYGTDNATLCTNDQMKHSATFNGFNFDTIWKMGDSRYPYPVLIAVPYISNQSVNPTPNPDVPDVDFSLQYGANRFTFGEDITGYVGDVVDSLVVYTSANENIASLDIKSSNTDVVEIGTIEIGVGDYITSENEHMATIPLKLKAEGTSTITITSPEGVSESVKVTVTADPISDFNAVTYVADRWLDESDVHYPTIHNFMYNFKDPSYETIKILSTDKDFLASVAAWETANVINDPTQIADDMVNKQQYYEAILFSLLSTQFEEGSLTDYIKATEITKTYKFTKNFTKFVNSIEGIDSHNILTKTLTESEKALISNDLKSLNSSQLLEGLSSCEILIDILDYSKDIEEFVNICGKYLTLLEVQSSTEKLLDTMYELCEVNLLSDADRVCLKEALRCVKNACNSQFGVLLAGVEKGTTQILQWTADAMCAEMWKTLCSSNVYVLCLKAGLSVGITISNTVFSTDKTIAQYYSMLCLNDVRQLINQAVVKLGQDYKTSKTQENAEAYIAAVGFVFDSYLLGCNYAVDFQKIVRNDSLAGKILFKNDNSFESFKKQAESLENEVSLNYTLLQKQWCYNLLDDYPELFDAVAKEIDLKFYANLEHSSIRVDGLSFDYTGKEITPNITVVMNGEKLVLDKDFTVTYSNNVNPGVAKVEVTGIGDYHGTNTATFSINEQWFDKKVDIRNNGCATLMRAFSLRSVSTVSNENSIEAPISIYVYDGDKEVALIENGEIVHSDIHVVVYGDRVTILMDNKDYRIVVNADQNTNIDYSYNEYDTELTLTKTMNYNNTILTSNTALTQTTGTDVVMLGNDELTPNYDKHNDDNEKHMVFVVGGAASANIASAGEWVSVAAIIPEGYKFVEWQASTEVKLLDKNSANTSFIMSDTDVELVAVFEEELLVDISGSITSFGNNANTVTIKLLQGSIEIDSVQTSNNSYVFEGVASGTYTLEVSKADHVTRTYEITVTDEDVVQDVKIHLLGDINGDGLLNIMDVNRANAHAKKRSTLTGYEFACADINGDETINIMDVNRMNAHAKKRALLW